MSKDAKDPKHKADGLRQPQRRDSLPSILSWAALQGKIASSKGAAASSSPPTAPGSGTSRPRRHSHGGTSSDAKPKARRGSTTFRRFSLSNPAAIQNWAGTKTKHTKTSPCTSDPKVSSATSKTGKNGSSEKVDKTSSGIPDAGKSPASCRSSQDTHDEPRSPAPPAPMPKSILRISSPDGYRRPRQFVNPDTGEPISPGLPPSSSALGVVSPGSPPGSPPMSPTQRPMSPGATVRFANATIHRVEVGPGRRFLPVKRKSKSTLTYISPLDPGTQKSAPKTMLQSPTKLRRHQENQAAMGRYWLQTEEEEARWRAEAERRAAEEAERYRNEPASPPPPSVIANASVEALEEHSSLTDKAAAIDKLPPLDSGPALDKVEEAVAGSESSDTNEEAGPKWNAESEETESPTLEEAAGTRQDAGGFGVVNGGAETTEHMIPDLQTQPLGPGVERVRPLSPTSEQAKVEAPQPSRETTAMAVQEPAADPAVVATTVSSPEAAKTPAATENAKLAESKSFLERLIEKEAAEEKTKRPASPTAPPPSTSTSKTSTEGSKSARSSSGSLSRESSGRDVTGRSGSGSTGSGSCSVSGEKQPARALSSKEEKEKAIEKSKEVSTTKSTVSLSSAGGARGDKVTASRGNDSRNRSHSHIHNDDHSHSRSRTQSHGGSRSHLHLSGRRGRRHIEGHKQGATA